MIMVNKVDAIVRLNREKEYEERLIPILTNYYGQCLDSIIELSDSDKTAIKEGLEILKNDTERHGHMFNQLLQLVMVSGKDIF